MNDFVNCISLSCKKIINYKSVSTLPYAPKGLVIIDTVKFCVVIKLSTYPPDPYGYLFKRHILNVVLINIHLLCTSTFKFLIHYCSSPTRETLMVQNVRK